MTQKEKKYRVDFFDTIRKYLSQNNISQVKKSTTIHYYGHQSGNNVTKLVEYPNKQEIHILEEKDGIFTLKDTIPVESIEEGLKWLQSYGFNQIDEIKMQSETFEYKGGLVRLYLLDDWLHSVILSHEGMKLIEVERELGLQDADVIVQPYNMYLDSIGKLNSMIE